MTVRELLTHLQGKNLDAVVLIPGYEGHWDTPNEDEVRGGVVTYQPSQSYYGNYRETRTGEGAVLLGSENG